MTDFFTHTNLSKFYFLIPLLIQFSITASVQYLLVYLIFSVIYNFDGGFVSFYIFTVSNKDIQ